MIVICHKLYGDYLHFCDKVYQISLFHLHLPQVWCQIRVGLLNGQVGGFGEITKSGC